jgi:hypothetical protein
MQGVAVHMPWTTGFVVGNRLNLWHRFVFYYEGESQTSANEIKA